jgi:hypothetical protein
VWVHVEGGRRMVGVIRGSREGYTGQSDETGGVTATEMVSDLKAGGRIACVHRRTGGR